MGVILKSGESLFIDTAPLIYFWEKHEQYYEKMLGLFNQVYALDIQCTVSLITYIEVVCFPLKNNKPGLAAKYRDYLTNSRNISLYPLNLLVADRTATFRARYNLKTPDAIQLATADTCGADYVLTNDKQWLKVDTLRVVQVEEL